MQRRYLLSIFFALVLVCASNLPVFACGLSHMNMSPPKPQNVEFTVTDRERAIQLVCHRLDPEDANSELACQQLAYTEPVLNAPLAVESSADSFDFANLLWVVAIIAIHFVFGLIHTWFREKKQDK